jgi:hypothetical protein
MELSEAVSARHSVRSYQERPIAEDAAAALEREIAACNSESGLHIQLIQNEPRAFGGLTAKYGSFKGVCSYFALVGPKTPAADVSIGYFGERLVLLAQTLGLNTCWVAASYDRRHCPAQLDDGEKLYAVIPVGYGTTQGTPHVSKPRGQLCSTDTVPPDWFAAGIDAAAAAPTAMNQQHFFISFEKGKVRLTSRGGFYSAIDLGIVRYNFEVGAGRENVVWEDEKS